MNCACHSKNDVVKPKQVLPVFTKENITRLLVVVATTSGSSSMINRCDGDDKEENFTMIDGNIYNSGKRKRVNSNQPGK